MTAWRDRYLQLESEIFESGRGANGLILVWTNTGTIEQRSQQQFSTWLRGCGCQPRTLDTASDNFSQAFLTGASQPTFARSLRPAPSAPSVSRPAPRLRTPQSTQPASPRAPAPQIHETVQLLLEPAFVSVKVKACPPTILPQLVKALFELKHNPTKADKFKDLKMMCDAMLRVQVYAYLQPTILRAVRCRASSGCFTAGADFVEALIAYALTQDRRKQRAYDTIIYNMLTMRIATWNAAGEEKKQSV